MEELSIFIDESGDFGKYEEHCPYYIVSLVFHDQKYTIQNNVKHLKLSLEQMGLKNHTVHTGPLIRKEKSYSNETLKFRYNLFNKLFHFTRNINIKYKNIIVNKKDNKTVLDINKKISKQLSMFIKENIEFFSKFDRIVVYYDNGQMQLTNIIMSVFSSNFGDCFEFKTVLPNEYRLFQTTDFICTLYLIEHKLACNKNLTSSENKFFGSARLFNKNFMKHIKKLEF